MAKTVAVRAGQEDPESLKHWPSINNPAPIASNCRFAAIPSKRIHLRKSWQYLLPLSSQLLFYIVFRSPTLLPPTSLTPTAGPFQKPPHMAAPFSATATSLSPKLNAPRALLSRPGVCIGHGYGKCFSTSADAFSCCSSTNSIRLQVAGGKFSGKSSATKYLAKKRTGIWKCATIEEIEAEKSSIEKDIKERLEKTLEAMYSSFNSIRTGRANPSMIDRVEIEYYGSPVGLKSIAQISTPDGSSILIQPFDKSSLKAIEKAIVSSDLDLTPTNDGEVIRLAIPPLTAERRKELLKIVSKQAEEGKVAIRNIRRDGIKAYEKLEKEKKLSKDNVKDLSSDMQKLVDEYIKKIDAIYKQKEKEVVNV